MRAPFQPSPGASLTLASASLWTLAASMAALALAIVQGKVIAVVLGTAGLGALATIASFLPVAATLATAMAGQGAVREIARARARGDAAELGAMIRYTAIAPLVLGFAVALATIAFAPVLSRSLLSDAAYAPLLSIAALALPGMVAAASYGAVLQGFSQASLIARAGIAASVAGAAATIGLTLAFGLTGAALGLVVVGIAQVAILIASAPWVLPALRSPGRLFPERLSTVITFSAAGLVLLFASNAVALLIRAEIATRLGLDTAGLYQPLVAVSDTYLEMLIASTGLYLFPRLSQLLARGERVEAEAELANGLRLLLVLTTPLFLVATAFSQPLLELLYSSDFSSAAPAFDTQMVGNVAKVVAWSVGAALLPSGYVGAWLAIGLVTVGLRYAIVHVLIGDLGLLGIAISYDVAWTWAAVASLWVVVRAVRLRIAREDAGSIALATVLVSLVVLTKSTRPDMALPVAAVGLTVWFIHARAQMRALVIALRPGTLRA